MRIAFVSSYDSTHVQTAWSGTGYFMPRALEQHPDINVLRAGPFHEPWKRLLQVKQAFYRYLLDDRTHLRDLEPITIRSYARQAERALRKSDADILLTTDPRFVRGIDKANSLKSLPFAVWGDATFDNLVGFYERYSNLSKPSLQRGHELWKWSARKASCLIFSSDWAAQSAIDTYGADPKHVHVVSFGTNLKQAPARTEVEASIALRSRDVCKLLFMSVDWKRKGGDTAVEVARTLNDQGLPTTLTVVGCKPEIDEPFPRWIEPLGYISKHTEDGFSRLHDVLSKSHFLVLPTLADCTPMVFAEANAYGVPVLSRSVGGIPTIVREGINGYLFSPDADPQAYSDRIQEVFSDYRAYEQLAMRSRHEQETRLNWNTAAASVVAILRDRLAVP